MKKNFISDKGLIERLRKIGCDVDDTTTYNDVVDWFREDCGVEIDVLPVFGGKIGYDTFEVSGYYVEYQFMMGGGMLLWQGSYNKFYWSYRETHPHWWEKEDVVVDRESRECFPTYLEAQIDGIESAIQFYNICRTYPDFYDIATKRPMEERTDYPKYLALVDDCNTPVTFFVFKEYSNKYHINRPIYTPYFKDEPEGIDDIEVLWDGDEFTVLEVHGNPKWKIVEGQLLKICEAGHIFLKKIKKEKLDISHTETLEKLKNAEQYI